VAYIEPEFNSKSWTTWKLKELSRENHRFAALENWNDNVDFSKALEGFRMNITVSAEESLGYYDRRSRFGVGC
jgi:hypothetical protein